MKLILALASGAVVYHAVLYVGGWTIVARQELDDQRETVAALEEENQFLTEEFLTFSARMGPQFDDSDLPYDENADARAEIAAARAQAINDSKFLMVTFGANWCVDCRTLYKHLTSEELIAYTSDRFLFANVDVGKFNHNTDVAQALGVSLQRGIPVAVFFNPDGTVLGATNNGELEPARRYTSRQILKFVRGIA
jgi:thiol:disulfide interchange protein